MRLKEFSLTFSETQAMEKSILSLLLFFTSNSKQTAGIPESVSLSGINGENALSFTSAGKEESEKQISAKGKKDEEEELSKQGSGTELFCTL